MRFAFGLEILDASIYSEHFSKLHSFVSYNLVLRGIALWARAILPLMSSSINGWQLQLFDYGKVSHSHILPGIGGSIALDENMSCLEVDPARWPTFHENRISDFLCIFYHATFPGQMLPSDP